MYLIKVDGASEAKMEKAREQFRYNACIRSAPLKSQQDPSPIIVL
jgi:hypothetical protein